MDDHQVASAQLNMNRLFLDRSDNLVAGRDAQTTGYQQPHISLAAAQITAAACSWLVGRKSLSLNLKNQQRSPQLPNQSRSLCQVRISGSMCENKCYS